MEGEKTAGDSAEFPRLHNSSFCAQGDDYAKETSRKRKKAAPMLSHLRKGPLALLHLQLPVSRCFHELHTEPVAVSPQAPSESRALVKQTHSYRCWVGFAARGVGSLSSPQLDGSDGWWAGIQGRAGRSRPDSPYCPSGEASISTLMCQPLCCLLKNLPRNTVHSLGPSGTHVRVAARKHIFTE